MYEKSVVSQPLYFKIKMYLKRSSNSPKIHLHKLSDKANYTVLIKTA